MESIRLEVIGWEVNLSKRSRRNSIVRDMVSEMSARSRRRRDGDIWTGGVGKPGDSSRSRIRNPIKVESMS